jgi:putative peptidoglycan lipid II flippase
VTAPTPGPNLTATAAMDPAPARRVLGQVGGATALLTVAAFGGQVAGLVRELYVAYKVGPSAALDALLVAAVLPVLISGLLTSGSRAALVPAHAQIAKDRGLSEAQRFVGAIITWTTIVALLLTVVMLVIPGLGVGLAGPGLSPDATAEAASYLPLLLPLIALGVLSALFGAVCQIAGRFGPIALSWLVGPFVSLAFAILAWDRLGLASVAVGMSLGSLVGVGLMAIAAARIGVLPPIAFGLRRSDLVDFLKHAGPLTLGGAVLQFNLTADRAIASLLSVGSISVLKFGQQLATEPLGSLSAAWTTSLYPSLVRSSIAGAERSLGTLAGMAFRYTFAIFVPISFGFAALAPILVDIVYRRGAFGAAAAAETSLVVAAFAPVIALEMLRPVLTGAHNARRNGTLLAVMAVTNGALNLAFNIVLARLLGVAGVALSTSLTIMTTMSILIWRLSRVEPDFDTRAIVSVALRVLVASAIPAVVVGAIAWGVVGSDFDALASIGALAVLGLVGAAGYLAIAALLGLREPIDILGRVIGSARARVGR